MVFPLQERYINFLPANFSCSEQGSYQNSLKYYRDLNNVVNTSREEGRAEGRLEGLAEGRIKQAQSLIGRQLARRFGSLPTALQQRITQLSLDELERLGDELWGFTTVEDVMAWVASDQGNGGDRR